MILSGSGASGSLGSRRLIEAANKVHAALLSTPASKSCKRVRNRARKRGADILVRMKKAQAQYDIDTDGGASQGARLRDD